MYCKNCGAQIPDDSKTCPECGSEQSVSVRIEQPQRESDAPSTGFAVLCFLFPVIGLILWLVWKDQYPLKAKSCGKGAIIGVCVSAGVGIFSAIIVGCSAAVIAGGGYYGYYSLLAL